MLAPLFAQDPGTIAVIVFFFFAVFFIVVFLAIFARFARLWIQAKTTNAEIGMFDLVGMWFRKVNPTVIVRSKIMAVQAGLGDETGITAKGARSALPRRGPRAAARAGDHRRP